MHVDVCTQLYGQCAVRACVHVCMYACEPRCVYVLCTIRYALSCCDAVRVKLTITVTPRSVCDWLVGVAVGYMCSKIMFDKSTFGPTAK